MQGNAQGRRLGAWLPACLALVLSGCMTGTGLVDGGMDVAAGQDARLPFQLAAAGTVHVAAESRNSTPFLVCLVPASVASPDLDRLPCWGNIRQATLAVPLAAGDWVVLLRCQAVSDQCRLAVRVFEA